MNVSFPNMVRAAMALSFLIVPVTVFSQMTAEEQQKRVAEFKQAVQKGQAALRKYEWVETTTILLKGEVKSQKQNRVYYGADGKLQKIPIGETPQQQQQPSGRRGRVKAAIVANKKEELSGYMKEAVDLLHRYIPPDPGLIQYEKQIGKLKVENVELNRVIRVSFTDFIVTGDLFTSVLNIQANAIEDINISTHLESDKDIVSLAVTMGRLNDGASFQAKSVLDAPKKDLRVVVENTGHRAL